ncbi:MAG: acyltransferase [Betaproteobacteria bacterium]|nr:acyltransferase [Betaproteobacteria bacterium]
MKKLIVIGAGGHAKVLVDALLAQSSAIIGLTDSDPAKTGKMILGVTVMGDDGVLNVHAPDVVVLVNGIGSVTRPHLRRKVFDSLKAGGYTFASVRHPSAIVSAHAQLGEGVQAMAGSVIQAGCVIGANTIINTNASVDHDCKVGAHVHIAPGATLSGGVEIGENVHVGAGATILQNVRVGNGSVIAAGAVVIDDVPANLTVFGTPARSKAK